MESAALELAKINPAASNICKSGLGAVDRTFNAYLRRGWDSIAGVAVFSFNAIQTWLMNEVLEVRKAWAAVTADNIKKYFKDWQHKRQAQMVKYFKKKEAAKAEEQKAMCLQVVRFLHLCNAALLET